MAETNSDKDSKKMPRRAFASVLAGGVVATAFTGIGVASKGKGILGFEDPSPLLGKTSVVTVSPDGPDDGGDFGPNTSGTTSSGIVEALKETRSIVFIKNNPGSVYSITGLQQTNDGVENDCILLTSGKHIIGESRRDVILRYDGPIANPSPNWLISNFHRKTGVSYVSPGLDNDQDLSVENLTLNCNGKIGGISFHGVNQLPGYYFPVPYRCAVKDVTFMGNSGSYFNVSNSGWGNSHNVDLVRCIFQTAGSGTLGGDCIGGGGVSGYRWIDCEFYWTTQPNLDASSSVWIYRCRMIGTGLGIAGGGPVGIPLLGGYAANYGSIPYADNGQIVVESCGIFPFSNGVGIYITQSESWQMPAPLVVQNTTIAQDTGDGTSVVGIMYGSSGSAPSPTPTSLILGEATIDKCHFYNLAKGLVVGRGGYIKRARIIGCDFRDLQSTPTMVGVEVNSTNQVSGITVEGNDFLTLKTPFLQTAVPSDTVLRNNRGYNPVAQLPAPAVTTAQLVNPFFVRVIVYVTVGGSTTTITKNGAFPMGTFTNAPFIPIELDPGETITLSQVSGISWQWWGF